MNLSSIPNESKKYVIEKHITAYDIEGASPCLKGYSFTNKDKDSMNTADINPPDKKVLFKEPRMANNNDDIDGCKPRNKMMVFKHTKEGRDPMNPK